MKSTLPDVVVPDVPIHFALMAAWDTFPDRVALVNGVTEESYTYQQLKAAIIRVASALHQRGLKKGDVLAIYSGNCPEYVIVLYAAMVLGVPVTTVNPIFTVYELCRQINNSGTKYIFASEETANRAKLAAMETGTIKEVYVNGTAPGCTSLQSLMGYSGPLMDPMSVPFNPSEDIVVLPYSSGTTGLPKGVMITHRNIVSLLMMLASDALKNPNIEEGEQSVVIGLLPFYHAYGLVGVLMAMLAGGSKIIILQKFTPHSFLSAVEKYKVTYLPLVPPLIIFLTNNPLVKQYDLSSIKNVGSGAAPLARDTSDKFSKAYGLTDVSQAFGMTETTLVALMTPPNKGKSGSVGIALPNTETKIIDVSTGKELGPNQRGELLIRGPQVMKGYHNRPEATRETIDPEGWLHTGDVAYYDEDKYFYIVDRIKELVKYKGFQVPPAELEALLLSHPGVADVAVTGVPDTEAGELPIAYVVKKPNVELSVKDVTSFVAERAAPYKRLRGGVEFLNEIPKTASGKILRRHLKERAAKKVKNAKL